MEALVIPAIVGAFLPPVTSLLKQTNWSSEAKQVFAALSALVAAVAAYFVQHGGWVGWEMLVADFTVIYVTAATTYNNLWENNRLNQVLTNFSKSN